MNENGPHGLIGNGLVGENVSLGVSFVVSDAQARPNVPPPFFYLRPGCRPLMYFSSTMAACVQPCFPPQWIVSQPKLNAFLCKSCHDQGAFHSNKNPKTEVGTREWSTAVIGLLMPLPGRIWNTLGLWTRKAIGRFEGYLMGHSFL